jgi:hypothetical protein
MMKKVVFFVVALLCFLPLSINAKEKVKVYMFEAGGCPFCEKQMEYFESLDSYGTKFEVIRKELYIDHIEWKEGKDYDLGKKVATEFKKAGFEDASYQGTPFVVISDIYAAASYNTKLESVIDEAYEAGDKDIVSCIEKGNTNCLNTDAEVKTESSSAGVIAMTLISAVTVIVVYCVKSTLDKKAIIEAIEKRK